MRQKNKTEGKGKKVLQKASVKKATAAGKNKGKAKAEAAASDAEEPNDVPPEEVDPQQAGCEVTSLDKQSNILQPYYKGLCPLM